jgi:hypothetical protein
LLKTLVASAAMGVAAHYGYQGLLALIPGGSELHRLVRVFGAIGIGLAVLAGSAHVLRIEEFSAAMARILSRLKPNPRT